VGEYTQPALALARRVGLAPQGRAEQPLVPREGALDLPAMMPPKVEVGWPDRPAIGPRRVYRAGRGFGFFSFARRFLLAHVRGRSCSSRRRRSSPASAQIT
jgi:hypothetical protein